MDGSLEDLLSAGKLQNAAKQFRSCEDVSRHFTSSDGFPGHRIHVAYGLTTAFNQRRSCIGGSSGLVLERQGGGGGRGGRALEEAETRGVRVGESSGGNPQSLGKSFPN